jgi:hypothetical protein
VCHPLSTPSQENVNVRVCVHKCVCVIVYISVSMYVCVCESIILYMICCLYQVLVCGGVNGHFKG